MSSIENIEFRSIDSRAWPDVEQLLGERGGREGCWCMRWRLPREQFERQKGSANKRALKDGLRSGSIKAVIGYLERTPVAWCSFGPRDTFPVLQTSELLRPVDEAAVWSIGCFFIHKSQRRQSVSVALLKAAVTAIGEQGGKVVEGYPLVPINEKIPAAFTWSGFDSAFKKAGFVEVIRRNEIRPIMRCYLD